MFVYHQDHLVWMISRIILCIPYSSTCFPTSRGKSFGTSKRHSLGFDDIPSYIHSMGLGRTVVLHKKTVCFLDRSFICQCTPLPHESSGHPGSDVSPSVQLLPGSLAYEDASNFGLSWPMANLFKLLGITYLVGKIKFKLLFQRSIR